MANNDPNQDSRWTSDDYNWLVGFDGEWRDLWYHEDFVALMAKRWALGDVRTLLDVGCGVGHWGHRLSTYLPPDATITGVDKEGAFVEKAMERAKAKKIPQSVSYQPATAESLPFEDNAFDCVTCQTVLMHVADPAVALQEMVRVLRPGGILITSEPSNMVSSYSILRAEPRPPWNVVSELLRFQHICEQGKMAKGDGDSSIGDKLPFLLRRAGLENILTYSNDKCPTLVPPYETPEEQLDIKQQLEWIDGDIWIGAGYHDDALDLFLVGGGNRDEFENLWKLALKSQQDFKRAILSKTLEGGRGVMHYLVSGRKSS